jgi:hypothetical protein
MHIYACAGSLFCCNVAKLMLMMMRKFEEFKA